MWQDEYFVLHFQVLCDFLVKKTELRKPDPEKPYPYLKDLRFAAAWRKCPMAEADPAASFFDSSTGTSRAVSCTSSCAIRQCSASSSHWNGTTAKSICWRNTSVGSEGLVQGYHQSYDHGRNGVFYCFLTNLQPTSL